MRARKILFIILVAFAAASAIAALTTVRQVRLDGSGRHFSELRNAPENLAADGQRVVVAAAFRSQMS